MRSHRNRTLRYRVALSVSLLSAMVASLLFGLSSEPAAAQDAATSEVIFETYLDSNANGIQDGDEGLIDVGVQLLDESTDPPTLIDGEPVIDGSVRFTDVAAPDNGRRVAMGPAGVAQNLIFRDGQPRVGFVPIVPGQDTTRRVGVTPGALLSIALDDPAVRYFIDAPGIYLPIEGTEPTVVGVPIADQDLGVNGPIDSEISGLTCDGQPVTPSQVDSPSRWRWSAGATAGQEIDCVVSTSAVSTGMVEFRSQIGFALLAFDSGLFVELGPGPFGRPTELLPGTYTITIQAGGFGVPTLVCNGEALPTLDPGVVELTVEPGSQQYCEVYGEPRTNDITFINANDVDLYGPPQLLIYDSGTPISLPLDAGTQISWDLGSTQYSFGLWITPVETFASFDCVGASSIELNPEAGSMSIVGTATDSEDIECTFTTVDRVRGDVNCDGALSILDATIIAQYAVGTRTADSACPITPGTNQINLSAADTNDDVVINILDAVRVAQCAVELSNSLCE